MVLYDFYADWCGMCKTMMPVIDSFSKKHPEVEVIKVNADEEEELSMQFDITHLPTIIFYAPDKVLYKCNRVLTLEQLEEIYEKSLKKC